MSEEGASCVSPLYLRRAPRRLGTGDLSADDRTTIHDRIAGLGAR